jgi:hypothetical protein
LHFSLGKSGYTFSDLLILIQFSAFQYFPIPRTILHLIKVGAIEEQGKEVVTLPYKH